MLKLVYIWLLVNPAWDHGTFYSPPVATLQDCQRIQQYVSKYANNTQCIQVGQYIAVPQQGVSHEQ